MATWADVGSQPLVLLCTSLLGQSSHPSDDLFPWSGWEEGVLESKSKAIPRCRMGYYSAPTPHSPPAHCPCLSPLPSTFGSLTTVSQLIPWVISSHHPLAFDCLQPPHVLGFQCDCNKGMSYKGYIQFPLQFFSFPHPLSTSYFLMHLQGTAPPTPAFFTQTCHFRTKQNALHS